MAYEYVKMTDVLKNSLVERREKYGTTDISKIIIDGNEFGGYKTFSSFWEKTYVKSPERSTNGVIGNLNSYTTFVTFHLIVNFAMMSIDDYRRLYDLMLQRNEFTVTAYNVLNNSTHTCKMYFAPDQMPKLYTRARKLQGEKFIEVLGVQDYTIELIGTNADIQLVEVRYYDEKNNLIPEATKSVYRGTEVIVDWAYTPANANVRFDGEWRYGLSIVRNGDIITPLSNINLIAKVKPTTEFSLSFDYGVGVTPIPQSSNDQVDVIPISYGQTIGTAIDNANITLANGNKFDLSTTGTGLADVTYNNKKYSGSLAYSFVGWYWSSFEYEQNKVERTTKYNFKTNKTVHQIYTPRMYAINFETNQSSISLTATTAKYGEKVNVPKLNVNGQTFKGWFWKDGETEVAFNGIMPPFVLNLYAKWE